MAAEPLVQRLSPFSDEISFIHESIVGAPAVPGRAGSLDAPLRAVKPRLGPCRGQLIVQEANGRMTALSGGFDCVQSPEVAHGVLVAAGRDRHARIVEHFRNRPLP